MPAPVKLLLLDALGKPIQTNTLPEVGAKIPGESLPVVLAKGVSVRQTFSEIPLFESTDNTTISASIILVLEENPDRRYLKITNTGLADVELWTVLPKVDQIGKKIPRGEVLKGGQQIIEKDTCRTNAVYATSFIDTTNLSVLEG